MDAAAADPAGFAALESYVGGGYKTINARLRPGTGQKMNPATQAKVDLIDGVLPRLVACDRSLLYRNHGLDTELADQRIVKGGEWVDAAFLSTTRSAAYIRPYLVNPHAVVFEIQPKVASAGRVVGGAVPSAPAREEEVLFPRGTRFLVADVVAATANKAMIVKLQEV